MDFLQPIDKRLNSKASRFVNLLQLIQGYYEMAGLPVEAFDNPSVPHFSALFEDRQIQLVNALEAQVSIIEDHLRQYKDLDDSVMIILAFLRKMNWTTPPELMSIVDAHDYLAIYSRFNYMLFLSPNHFRLTSYTLEDLYCRPPLELFRRPATIESILVKRLLKVSDGREHKIIMNDDIPPHAISEAFSRERRQGVVRAKGYAPVFLNDESIGFLSANFGQSLSSRAMPQPASS